MSTAIFPKFILDHYEFYQWKHACAILKSDFQNEWKDILALLKALKLEKTWINEPGGRKTKLANWFDEFLFARDWCEKKFDTSVIVDEHRMDSPTHKIDCYKNRIALELEWNNNKLSFA